MAPGSEPSGTMNTPIAGVPLENSPWFAGGSYSTLRTLSHTLLKAWEAFSSASRTTPTVRRAEPARAAVCMALKLRLSLSFPPASITCMSGWSTKQ